MGGHGSFVCSRGQQATVRPCEIRQRKQHQGQKACNRDADSERGPVDTNIHMRWVATYQMLGDILTKRGVSADLLMKVLNWGMFTVIEDKSIRPKNQQGVKRNYFGGV